METASSRAERPGGLRSRGTGPILASKNRRIYIGVTNDLQRRWFEHAMKARPGHTAKYRIDRLVYFEATSSIVEAIRREKQLKNWNRGKKLALIHRMNPTWIDYAEEWGWRREADPSTRA